MTTSTLPSLTALLAQGGPVHLDRSPRALTVQMLRTTEDGVVVPEAALVREGGSSSTTTSVLRGSDGDPVVTATLTSGRSRGAESYAAVPMPDVPGPEECDGMTLPVELVPYGQHVEHRPATSAVPLGRGPVAELVAWVRYRADEPLDSLRLTVLADAMPPALYAVTAEVVPVPTVELSVAYAAGLDESPRRGWVLVRIATRTAADGWCVDDSEVWAPDVTLLVQARQTRRVLGELTR